MPIKLSLIGKQPASKLKQAKKVKPSEFFSFDDEEKLQPQSFFHSSRARNVNRFNDAGTGVAAEAAVIDPFYLDLMFVQRRILKTQHSSLLNIWNLNSRISSAIIGSQFSGKEWNGTVATQPHQWVWRDQKTEDQYLNENNDVA